MESRNNVKIYTEEHSERENYSKITLQKQMVLSRPVKDLKSEKEIEIKPSEKRLAKLSLRLIIANDSTNQKYWLYKDPFWGLVKTCFDNRNLNISSQKSVKEFKAEK